MEDRCQIPPDLRKRVGSIGGTEHDCLAQTNSCWDPRPAGDAPNCYRDNSVDQCKSFKGCDKSVNLACFNQLWKEAGCTTQAPSFKAPFKGQSYHKVVKEIQTFSKSTSSYKFNKCFGGGANKISYCTATKPKTCNSLDDRGTIIKCETCSRHFPSEGNVWLYKDGHRVLIPHCDCQSANKAANLTNTIQDNVCGNPLRVPKTQSNYVSKQETCTAAWKTCSTTEDCCPGYQCRQGDRRCLTEDQFKWSAWQDKADRDPTVITKIPPVISLVEGRSYHLISEAHDALYLKNGHFTLHPQNQSQYLMAWTLGKSDSNGSYWSFKNGLHYLDLSFKGISSQGKAVDWNLIKQGGGPEGNTYVIQCKYQGAAKGLSRELYVPNWNSGNSYIWRNTTTGGNNNWKPIPGGGALTCICASGRDYLWGVNIEGSIWWASKNNPTPQWTSFPGGARWVSADDNNVYVIGGGGGVAGEQSGGIYHRPVNPTIKVAEDWTEMWGLWKYITATGTGYLFSIAWDGSIWCAPKTGADFGKWTKCCPSCKAILITADQKYVYHMDPWGGLYRELISTAVNVGNNWSRVEIRAGAGVDTPHWMTNPKQFTSIDASGPDYVWATVHLSDAGGTKMVMKAKKPNPDPGGSITLTWVLAGPKWTENPDPLGNISVNSQLSSGGTCPKSHPVPYDGNGVSNGWCCGNNNLRSSGGYGEMKDVCVSGQTIQCENPPCALGNVSDLVHDKYLASKDGTLDLVDKIGAGTKWKLVPENISEFITQNTDQPSDCDLIKAWNDPSVKWFYGGKDKVKGLKSNGEIFYTTKDKLVIIPEGQCEVQCDGERFNICDQMNRKIKNCHTNYQECHAAVTTKTANPFQPTNVDPDCFYAIPILNADGTKKTINHGRETTTVESLKCHNSEFYNPTSVDAAFPVSFNDSVSICLIKGIKLYRFTVETGESGAGATFNLTEDYPQPTKNILGRGLPSNIDAVVPKFSPEVVKSSGGNNRVDMTTQLVFSGSNYYNIYGGVFGGSITSQGDISSTWLNAPDSIDAAIWIPTDGTDYQLCFFRNSMVYVVNSVKLVSSHLTKTEETLYLLDDPTNGEAGYSIKSMEEAKSICEQCNGRLASLEELQSIHRYSAVHAEYAAWTTSDTQYTFYAENDNHGSPIIKCTNGSCQGVGGVWCLADPKKFILAGIADPRPISSKFPGCPDYVDSAVAYYYQGWTPDDIIKVFKGAKVYNMDPKTLRVKLDNHKLASNVFKGLPEWNDSRYKNQATLCKEQYKWSDKYKTKKQRYDGSSEIMNNGYDNLIKSRGILKELTQEMASNEQKLSKLDSSANMLNRQVATSQYADKYKDGYINSLKFFLLALFICVILTLLRNSGKVGFLQGKRFAIVILIVIAVTIVIIISTLWKKLWRTSAMRAGLVNWKSPPQDKMSAGGSGPGSSGSGGSDSKAVCNKLRAEQEKIKNQLEKVVDKGFNRFPDRNLSDDGITLLTKDGIYQGKLLSGFDDAKGICLSLPNCDGMRKRSNDKYYDLFNMKTNINNIIKPDDNSILFIKQTCRLGKLKGSIDKDSDQTPGTNPTTSTSNNAGTKQATPDPGLGQTAEGAMDSLGRGLSEVAGRGDQMLHKGAQALHKGLDKLKSLW